MPRRPLPRGEGAEVVVDAVSKLARRADVLEQPDGNQLKRALAKVLQLITDLPGLVNAYLASGFTTGSMTASGTVTATGGMNSVGVYNNLLLSGYRVQYVASGGAMGYVPSSRRFKRNIVTAPDIKDAALAIRVVTFRYRAMVKELGDEALVEWGVIAEELHELGFYWAVDYDEEGQPFGVKYDRLVLAVFPVIQDHEERLRAGGL